MFEKTDWRGCIVALTERTWERHIKPRHPWLNDSKLPLMMQTLANPDRLCRSPDNENRLEVYRLFPDLGYGEAGYLEIIVEYEPDVQNPMSGSIVTAYEVDTVDCVGGVF